MTDCCTTGTNLAVLLLKVGALGFATSAVLFHLHPMKKKHFSISQRSDKDTSLLTKDQDYVEGNREEGPLEVYTSVPGWWCHCTRQADLGSRTSGAFISSPSDFAVVIFYLDPCIKQALTAPIDMFNAQMRPSQKSMHNSGCHLPHVDNMSKMRHLHFRSVALYNGSLAWTLKRFAVMFAPDDHPSIYV